jgi:uncharacterized cupin superfamily protein
MISSFDATSVPVVHDPLDPDKARSDGVSTGLAEVVSEAGLDVGVWEHSVGSSTDSFGDEVFVVLSGAGVVRCQNGGEIVLAPGIVGVLHAGDVTTWEITEPLRKVWVVRS